MFTQLYLDESEPIGGKKNEPSLETFSMKNFLQNTKLCKCHTLCTDQIP